MAEIHLAVILGRVAPPSRWRCEITGQPFHTLGFIPAPSLDFISLSSCHIISAALLKWFLLERALSP